MIHIFLLVFLLVFPLVVQAEEVDATLRLELIRANLYLQTNQQEKALRLLESLKIKYADNPTLLAAEANAYLQAGYRGRALGVLNRLSFLNPDNKELPYLRERVAETTSYAAIDGNLRFTGDYLTEYLTRFSGIVPYSPHLSAGIIAEHNNVDMDWLTRIDGETRPFKGSNTRGELYADYNYDNGNHAVASIFMAEAVAGIGLLHSWLDKDGVTNIELNIQRPDWEFIEQVADRGRRDKLSVGRTHLFTPRLSLRADAGLNRYGLSDEINIANSATFFAGVSYIIPPFEAIDMIKHHAALWLDYAVDIEHPFHVEKRTDSDGFVFVPLPLESREIHSITTTLTQDIHKDVSYELFAGYAYDRLGGDGPIFGAYITWWPLQQLALEGNISRSIRKETSTETVDSMGIRGKWLF